MSHKTSLGRPCPACGEGNLTPKISYLPYEYKGHTENLALHSAECDVCGSDMSDKTDVINNNRIVAAFQKRIDGFLSGSEIASLRSKYHITQELAASLFGGGKVAFSRYENDDVTQSAAMDSLIKLCQENPFNLILLARLKKINLPEKVISLVDAEYYQESYKNMFDLSDELDEELSRKVGKLSFCANDPKFDSPVLLWASA